MLCFLLFSAITFHAAVASEFAKVKYSGIEGAIVPSGMVRGWHESIRKGRGEPHGIQNMLGVEAQDFWTPEPKDVQAVESQLLGAIEKAAKDPSALDRFANTPQAQKRVSGRIEVILENYRHYRRQYIGLVIDGKKVIYVNSFTSEDRRDYAEGFITASDGGTGYWQILYSMEERTFHHLCINGDA